MTKVAVMGKFFNKLEDAKKYLLEKEARFKKSQVIVELENGFLVVPLSQMSAVNSSLAN